MTDNPFGKIARKKKQNVEVVKDINSSEKTEKKNETTEQPKVFTKQPKINIEENSNKSNQEAHKYEYHEHNANCCPKCKSINIEKCSSFYEKNKYDEAKCEVIDKIIPKTPVQVAVENIWFSVFLSFICSFTCLMIFNNTIKESSPLGCITSLFLLVTLSFVFNGIFKYIYHKTNIFDIFLTPLSKVNWKKINIWCNNKLPLVFGISAPILTVVGIFAGAIREAVGDSIDLTKTGCFTIVICLCLPLLLLLFVCLISWIFKIFFSKNSEQYDKELEEWNNCFICNDCKNVFIIDNRKIDNGYKPYSSIVELNSDVLKRLHELGYFKAEIEEKHRRGIPILEGDIVKTGEKLHFYEIDIPNVYTDNEINYKISSISDFLFASVKSLVRISIPSSVTKIGKFAFNGLNSLKTVILPEGIKNIDSFAFHDCENLMSVRPSNCIFNASEIIIPKTVEKIGDGAFAGCNSINTVIIPDTVKEIGENAFAGIRNIYYNGQATGTPWGAYRLNNLQESKDKIETKEEKKKQEKNIFIVCLIITILAFIILLSNCKRENSYHDYYSSNYSSSNYSSSNYTSNYSSSSDTSSSNTSSSDSSNSYTSTYTSDDTTSNYSSSSSLSSSDYTDIVLDENTLALLNYDVEYHNKDVRSSARWNNQKTILKKYDEEVTSLNIPAHFDSLYSSTKYKITEIGKEVFWGSNLTSVIIPDGVTGIEDGAFQESDSLTYVHIPLGVAKIGSYAFCDCGSLESLIIPDSVKEIHSNAFAYCSKLKDIDLSTNLTAIEDETFYSCRELSNIIIPNTVTKIGKRAFEYCEKLTDITIPDSVTHIEESAFEDCSSLKNITIPNSVIYIGRNAFDNCKSLESVTIPEGVKYIGANAFKNVPVIYYNGIAGGKSWGAKKLVSNKKAEVSQKVAELPKLDPKIKYTEVALDKKVLYQLGYNPADKKKFTSVKIPYTYKFKGKNYKITKIAEKAFYNYASLQDITIEEGIQVLGISAFENCVGLKTVKLPNTLYKINNNAFANCKALNNVNLPDGLTELRESIFFNCIALKNIEIPSSVTKIGDMVFYKCKSLEKITIPENVISIGQSAFAGCRGLKELKLPSNLTTIKQWAFSNCVSLNRVDIPDTVTSIGEEAFANVPYVSYNGFEDRQPWGALDSNKLPEIPYSLEDIRGVSQGRSCIEKTVTRKVMDILGTPTRGKEFYVIKNRYPIHASWFGDSVMMCWSDSCGSVWVESILCCSRNGLKTDAGIQVGDPESKLLESYSGLQKVKTGHYYVTIYSNNEDNKYIHFKVKDGRVRKIYVYGSYSSTDSKKLYELVAKEEGF